MRRLVSSLPVQATAVLVAVVLGIMGLRAQHSRTLLAAFQDGSAPYELVVLMSFEPEAFHLAEFQKAGRIVGVDGMTVHVRAVDPEQLRRLSRQPWITGLEPRLASN